MQRKLPFVFVNIATTLDGKLAPANRHFVPFSSKRDQRLLLELRTTADAVMAGARTVDLMPADLGPGPPHYRRMRLKNGLAEYNLRVVVSGAGTLDPHAVIFRHRFSPIIILASGRASDSRLRKLREVADEVAIFGERELDFESALRWLRKKWNVKCLLCEGGGKVNGALFRAGLVNQIYQTLCPLVFGGDHAPTMADGPGVENISQAARFRLKSVKRVAGELFLIYRSLKR